MSGEAVEYKISFSKRKDSDDDEGFNLVLLVDGKTDRIILVDERVIVEILVNRGVPAEKIARDILAARAAAE